jgi:hypothetical protein
LKSQLHFTELKSLNFHHYITLIFSSLFEKWFLFQREFTTCHNACTGTSLWYFFFKMAQARAQHAQVYQHRGNLSTYYRSHQHNPFKETRGWHNPKSLTCQRFIKLLHILASIKCWSPKTWTQDKICYGVNLRSCTGSLIISHEWEMDWIVMMTNGSYP